MAPEPAQSAVSTFAAGLSAGALALLGVSYHGLLWALIGAIVALMFTPAESRGQALAAVVGGMFTGAVLSDLLILLVPTSLVADERLRQAIHLPLAFVGGAGAKQFLGAIIKAFVARIARFGGE